MKLNVNISIPDLWGEKRFQKNEWGGINLLVGPNATGKTRFVEQLVQQLVQQYKAQGLKVRYLSSERLAGFSNKGWYEGGTFVGGFPVGGFNGLKETAEKLGQSYSAFIVLKEKPDIKMKVEIVLSQFFGKRIEYSEEAGYLKPRFTKFGIEGNYDIKQNECHGLKELIALLTFLYDDENNCLIIDEPELHLHPQFQTFFLQEIRKIDGDPLSTLDKKCFFIVTHSPYFVDIRFEALHYLSARQAPYFYKPTRR